MPAAESSRLPLLLEKACDLVEEHVSLLFEQHEMRGVRDQHALLYRRMNKIAHQAFAILKIRPRIVLPGNHECRHIDVARVPQRPPVVGPVSFGSSSILPIRL
jgi:hypothetical protein